MMSLKGRKVMLHDMCLRDGMHAKRHQMTLDEMVRVATALDDAGVPLIQVTHGDGLGGASLNYGRPRHSNEEYLNAVIPKLKRAKVSVLLVPGLGTMDQLRSARECGVHSVHVATHCTEADVAEQHIAYARGMGMDTTGFLMMSHLNSPEGLLKQGLLMESYGANCIYVTDSAGYMLPDDVRARIALLRNALDPKTQLGFHGHHNLGMGIANSIAAIEAGANRIDGSVGGLGAGAGNTPLEVFAAVCERMGIHTGVDLFKMMDVAEDVILPLMDQLVRVDRESLTIGYAGVYSTFLLFARRAAAKYGVSAREILIELGKKKLIGGQEDMIEDTAMTMAKERGLLPS
ncbi:4-hydroxy-2-oxovalerate aldolase [Janthinobacterium sp. 17J80-10]|uniref:4-hydroxy-2-oxovalerate aldolase n=1 Tax=Janthinobacterium sp. 17J80-10 TaxID=2497863 RepID=UPI0010055F82|nr:4-hydroxy-2-oxovalerate aldolase [Janthinobacterium sp. 17J80-10]